MTAPPVVPTVTLCAGLVTLPLTPTSHYYYCGLLVMLVTSECERELGDVMSPVRSPTPDSGRITFTIVMVF